MSKKTYTPPPQTEAEIIRNNIIEMGRLYYEIHDLYHENEVSLLDKDCQRVEFLRGEMSAYNEVMNLCSKWKIKYDNLPSKIDFLH